MEDLKNFASAIGQIAEEKGISKEKVIEIIEQAYSAAYKKEYGKKGQIIKTKLDSKSGKVKFWQEKLVVDEKMIYSEEELKNLKDKALDEFQKTQEETKAKKVRFNPEKHIILKEAKKIKPKIKVGEILETALEMKKDYGRIAAQTAKQVILQKSREAEREIILQEYKSKEGQIISGIVQRVEPRAAFFDIGKTLGILPREEQVPGEFYRPGQRLKLYVVKVEESPRGPSVFLSRAYPKIISKLFELEVPEVSSGSVVIKSIAREPGSRSKIAVVSEAEGVDPIGAMVGQRGTRVSAVINELGGEKIDIIEWAKEPEKFITNSLSPAKVLEVKIMPKNKALAVVPEDQLSLAIGKDGQNVRLAAKLTGWKIDVRSPQSEEGAKEEKKETKKASKEAPKKKAKEKKKAKPKK
ncbi:MAG TPA: transcription termination factor NusA [Candidatus Parcubacteria bacterium]|jgi:N utilization substance protein A|nr:transcription termination factor NusA [Candidatus Parcubacteria bacterium]|tara:strand:+ start:17435 stop:18667 length:1233 start_codon:yes stop_codon:yes gene_type:complete